MLLPRSPPLTIKSRLSKALTPQTSDRDSINRCSPIDTYHSDPMSTRRNHQNQINSLSLRRPIRDWFCGLPMMPEDDLEEATVLYLTLMEQLCRQRILQARINHFIFTLTTLLSVGILLAGCILLLRGEVDEGVVNSVSGTVTTAISSLLMKLSSDQLDRLAQDLKALRQAEG